jgi:ribosome-associated protein
MNNLKICNINIDELIDELEFKTTRSSGKGGQNVNKVSTKVILIFNLSKSRVLSQEHKRFILNNIEKRVHKDGCLHISSSKSRSQFDNKKDTIERFTNLINNSLEKKVKRIETKPTKKSVAKRKTDKEKLAAKKQSRKLSISEE